MTAAKLPVTMARRKAAVMAYSMGSPRSRLIFRLNPKMIAWFRGCSEAPALRGSCKARLSNYGYVARLMACKLDQNLRQFASNISRRHVAAVIAMQMLSATTLREQS
jgi:hypothetical protein